MRPLDDFPSSPSSAYSAIGSADHSPPTPDSYFSPTPAIASPDEFTFQIDVQLDKMVEPHHNLCITPRPPVRSPKSDPCHDDTSKLQVYLRNRGKWGTMHDRLESSPPPRRRDVPRILPITDDGASDDFSWEAAHSPVADIDELADPSRCSLLIHEVSLLVGLTADDDYLSSGDGYPLAPDPSIHDILPLTLTPTESLASGRHRKPNPPHTDVPVVPRSLHIPPGIAHCANPSPHNREPPPVGLPMPVPRQRNTDAGRLYSSPRRRQGQVFHLDPLLSSSPSRNAVLDETFCHPRDPPPKPPLNHPANRCSSLDRLECSLLKLEAYAPRNHRKSQSEGRSTDHVSQRMVQRPSLPPPRRLKRQKSSNEIMHRNQPRLPHGRHVSGPPPVPRPMSSHQYVAPRICPPAPSDDDHFEEDLTPGSFMDMDIPPREEVSQNRRTSLGQLKSKEKMKSLVNVAKRVSRGMIAWGKNFTGSTKPPVTARETTTAQSVRV